MDIEQLFRSNYPAMLTLAFRLTRDEEVARDIVQDRFADLLADCPENVTPAYLLQGVRYACLNHIRNLALRERIKNLYALDLEEFEADDWPGEDDISLINTIIDCRLSPQTRRIVKMRFNQWMTYKEISNHLGISEVAVYKNLRHALDVLRKNFNGK